MKIKGKDCKDWTVESLKMELKKIGEKSSGKKDILCDRLRLAIKARRQSSIIQKGVLKNPADINMNNSLFKFYASTFIENPSSKMSINYLISLGLPRNKLIKCKSPTSLRKLIVSYK